MIDHTAMPRRAPPRPAAAATGDFDTRKRYVRIVRERANGFVEFEFAIGEPDLSIEMILGREAFAEFCRDNQVETLAPRAAREADDDWNWRLSDARQHHFKP